MRRLGITPAPRYRTVDEADIIDQFLCFGWAYEMQADGRDSAVRQAGEALEQIVGLGLPFRVTPDGRRRFDPVEMGNFITWLGIHKQTSIWETQFIATGRKIVSEFHSPAPGPNLPQPATLPAQRFSVTLRREFNLRHLPAGTLARLRLPWPIEDETLRDLTLQAVMAPDLATDLVVTPGRLEGRFRVPQGGDVVLSWTASFTAYPTTPASAPLPLRPSESELYTQPREAFIRITPRVRALADSLAGSLRDPWTIAQRFWHFMLDQLKLGFIHLHEVDHRRPMDWVLDNGWYECWLGSSLLVTLCRARGIAARLVSGYVLYPKLPAFHYWAEFWDADRGWVPVDTQAAPLSACGRDTDWRDYFFGQLDYRMKTECLPRLFTGHPTVRFPPIWHLRSRPLDAGVETGIFDTDSGVPAYRDHVAVVKRVNAEAL
jgi:hypothetical protein